DADVDAQGNLYLASWKGATFDWEGPDVGYIVRVRPRGMKDSTLPNFDRMPAAQLVKALESPSHRRRLEAQRALLRNDLAGAEPALLALLGEARRPLPARIAALYALALSGRELPSFPPASDPLLPHAVRAFEKS